MTEQTILRLAGVGVTPYSARGLKQTLTHTGGSSVLRRTINGTLLDMSSSQFRKYTSTISGSDVAPPAVDGLWPGHTVVVDCINELAVLDPNPTATTESTTEVDTELGRPHVPGSVRRADGFVYYRPRLTFMVTAWSMDANEWEAGVDWSLALEEV